jgi:hypothetical protein
MWGNNLRGREGYGMVNRPKGHKRIKNCGPHNFIEFITTFDTILASMPEM